MKKRALLCLLCILFLLSACGQKNTAESLHRPLEADAYHTEQSYNRFVFFADALEFPSASGFGVLRTESDMDNRHESLCFPVHTSSEITALLSNKLRERLDTLVPENATLVKLDFDYFSEATRYDFSFILDIYEQDKHIDTVYFALYLDVESMRFLSFGEILDSAGYMQYLRVYVSEYLQTVYKIEKNAAGIYSENLEEPDDFRLIDDGTGGMEIYLDGTAIGLPRRTLIEVPESRLYSFGTPDSAYDPVGAKERAVALTFDGGLSEKTLQILEQLQDYNAHGTFFLLGKSLETVDATAATRALNTILGSGSELGNLSYSGENFLHFSHENVTESIYKTQNLVYNLCGVYPRLIRPPTGGIQDGLLKKLDQFVIHWSVNLDYDKTLGLSGTDNMTPEQVADCFIQRIKNGSIVVIHEENPAEVSALPLLLSRLDEKGYRLVTVSELLSLADTKPNGTIYKSK